MSSGFIESGANVIIDGQWGSTGKGKLAAYLAEKHTIGIATADFQSNAGHTVVYKGETYVVHHVPAAFVNDKCMLYLTPAASITLTTFLRELEILSKFRVSERISIHPNCGVITPELIEEERRSMQNIASTMKGVGAALAQKVRRKAPLARDIVELHPFINDHTMSLCRAARRGVPIIVETAQGFDLSLNHGMAYPYTTSRDVTTASALSNAGLPPQSLATCWASLRTFPIRVGHIYDDNGSIIGHSGPCWPDQEELTWDEITKSSGSKTDLREITTVTKRVRRIFTWSRQQYKRFKEVCAPTHLFLNFVNYLDASLYGAKKIEALSNRALWDFIEYAGIDDKLALIGTGPDHEDMVEFHV